MIEAWTEQRSVRVFLAVSTLVGGFVIAVVLLHQREFPLASAIFALALAALVGTGKLATP